MKSSAIHTQNQRVQHISPTTVVVGIDIGKAQHVAQATDFRGIVLTKRSWAFANTHPGFESLLDYIQRVQRDHGLDRVVVGMESTGHYFWNLAQWLLDHDIEVVIVNPATTKRNKENRDNTPSKSDPKDALVIADVVSRGYYTPYQPGAAVFERLRVLVRNREHWVVEAGRVKNRITRWVDIRFPEYHRVFPNLFGPRSLATLRLFPVPADLTGLSIDQVMQAWGTRLTRPGGDRGRRKATALLQQARASVGVAWGLGQLTRHGVHADLPRFYSPEIVSGGIILVLPHTGPIVNNFTYPAAEGPEGVVRGGRSTAATGRRRNPTSAARVPTAVFHRTIVHGANSRHSGANAQ